MLSVVARTPTYFFFPIARSVGLIVILVLVVSPTSTKCLSHLLLRSTLPLIPSFKLPTYIPEVRSMQSSSNAPRRKEVSSTKSISAATEGGNTTTVPIYWDVLGRLFSEDQVPFLPCWNAQGGAMVPGNMLSQP